MDNLQKIKATMEEFWIPLLTIRNLLDDRDKIHIGGSGSLVLHGLDIGRRIDDLDIILTNPTEEVINYIKNKSNFNYNPIEDGSDIENIPEEEKRSLISLFSKGLKINFLKYDSSQPILKTNREINMDNIKVYYEFNHFFWRLQPIINILDAKRSYIYEEKTKGDYIRKKDVLDMEKLRNSNFYI